MCVYPSEHFQHWRSVLGVPFGPGAFGENLTTGGKTEEQVCIGDVFRLGEATVEVTQPRQPCFKLAAKYDFHPLPLLETGYTGYYLRVLEDGIVRPQAVPILKPRPENAVSIAFANRIMHHDKLNEEGIERILAQPSLSANWRRTLTKRRNGESVDPSAKPDGGN